MPLGGVRDGRHAEALQGNDALLTLIDRLVDRVADEVHRVEVPDADLLQDSRWYQTARPTRRKVLTSAVASPPGSAPSPIDTDDEPPLIQPE